MMTKLTFSPNLLSATKSHFGFVKIGIIVLYFETYVLFAVSQFIKDIHDMMVSKMYML